LLKLNGVFEIMRSRRLTMGRLRLSRSRWTFLRWRWARTDAFGCHSE